MALIPLSLMLFGVDCRDLGLGPMVFLCTLPTALASARNMLVAASLCGLVFRPGLSLSAGESTSGLPSGRDMDLLANLALGCERACTLQNLFWCFMGCFWVVLPGIGPMATITMLLPIAFALVTALIFWWGSLAGARLRLDPGNPDHPAGRSARDRDRPRQLSGGE